eukprot:sb/3470794/
MTKFSAGMQPLEIEAVLGFTGSNTTVTTDTKIYKRVITTGLSSSTTVVTGESKSFTCEAAGDNNDDFSISWSMEGTVLNNTDSTTITEGKTAGSTTHRTSSITLTNIAGNVGTLGCSADWTSPEETSVDSEGEVDMRNATMAAISKKNADGDGEMVVTAWSLEKPTVAWSKGDTTISNENDKLGAPLRCERAMPVSV